MNQVIPAALLVLGFLLLVVCINPSQSISSEVVHFLAGVPAGEIIWVFLGGALALVSGLVLSFRRSKGV
jgi:hypothetical protein